MTDGWEGESPLSPTPSMLEDVENCRRLAWSARPKRMIPSPDEPDKTSDSYWQPDDWDSQSDEGDCESQPDPDQTSPLNQPESSLPRHAPSPLLDQFGSPMPVENDRSKNQAPRAARHEKEFDGMTAA